MDIKIESWNKHNIRELAKLFTEIWPETSFEEEYEFLKKHFQNENEHAYLLKDQNRYFAFVYLSLRQDYVEGSNSSPTAYLEGIYVQAEFRKKGFGDKLIELAEHWTRSKGLVQLASDVEIENLNSQDFHKSQGFHEVNRIINYIKTL